MDGAYVSVQVQAAVKSYNEELDLAGSDDGSSDNDNCTVREIASILGCTKSDGVGLAKVEI